MKNIVAIVEEHENRIDDAGIFLLETALKLAQEKQVPLKVEILKNVQSIQVREYAAAFRNAIQIQEPSVYLIAATQFGNELASMTAIGLKIPCGLICDAAEISNISRGTGKSAICVRRLATDGRSVTLYECGEDTVQLVTLKPQRPQMDMFEREERSHREFWKKAGQMRILFPVILKDTPEILRDDTENTEAQDIEHANYVFSGGRGIGGREGYQRLEELAAVCGAKTATSRANVDEGWISKERQVGLSGKVIAPKVYFAVGISGAAHHVIGIEDAETVIAVNADRNAPIFDVADLGIVADGQKVIDHLQKILMRE